VPLQLPTFLPDEVMPSTKSHQVVEFCFVAAKNSLVNFFRFTCYGKCEV